MTRRINLAQMRQAYETMAATNAWNDWAPEATLALIDVAEAAHSYTCGSASDIENNWDDLTVALACFNFDEDGIEGAGA